MILISAIPVTAVTPVTGAHVGLSDTNAQPAPEKKRCRICGAEKILDDFYERESRGKVLRRGDCKQCCIARVARWKSAYQEEAKRRRQGAPLTVEPWTVEDDDLLIRFYGFGKTTSQLMDMLAERGRYRALSELRRRISELGISAHYCDWRDEPEVDLCLYDVLYHEPPMDLNAALFLADAHSLPGPVRKIGSFQPDGIERACPLCGDTYLSGAPRGYQEGVVSARPLRGQCPVCTSEKRLQTKKRREKHHRAVNLAGWYRRNGKPVPPELLAEIKPEEGTRRKWTAEDDAHMLAHWRAGLGKTQPEVAAVIKRSVAVCHRRARALGISWYGSDWRHKQEWEHRLAQARQEREQINITLRRAA